MKAACPVVPSRCLRDGTALASLASTKVDWIININSTVLLPSAVLTQASQGAVNMHPGLLPEYAGLHTHQWAIRNGERECGITIHFMEPGLDTGDIILQRRFAIRAEHTGLTLFLDCMREGTEAMRDVLTRIAGGAALPRAPQDATRRRLYRHGDALDGRIDWTWPAAVVERFVRAGNYLPFESPSYTAFVETTNGHGDCALEVMDVRVIEEAAGAGSPGEVGGTAGGSPIVGCGDGRGVALRQARVRGADRLLDPPDIVTLLPRGTVLRGRSA
jgi:UDP-4-amino-4-deoxy-L-arabinose formyltransferase/UDP-glucuronic acid dehydrogenase (UDP-4-keto-hexauronic acid decarboxylating)